MKKRELNILGSTFSSLTEAAKEYGLTVQLVSRRLKGDWTLEQAVGVEPPPKRLAHNAKSLKTIKGQFESVREASKASGVPEANIIARLKLGWTSDQACGFASAPKKGSNNASQVKCAGKIFVSKAALADAYDIPYRKLAKRLRIGWTPEQAVGLEDAPPRYRNSDGSKRDHSWANPQTTSDGKMFAGSKDGTYLLYAIENNINDKKYIGVTTTTLATRFYHHQRAAEDNKGGSSSKFYNAMRKFGLDNFSIILLRDDAKSIEELLEQEMAAIKEQDTVANGYNTSTGGTLGTGKPIAIEGRSFDTFGQAASFYGVDPAVFALRVSRLGWTPEQAAEVNERESYGRRNKSFCLNDGNESLVFASVTAAAAYFNLNPQTVHARLKRGWSFEKACLTRPK